MKFILYHPVHFEEWDYRNLETGIGGSETNQIEMAWRLAKRGHEVISYAPIPDDCESYWRGVEWRHLEDVDFAENGIWIIYRSPNTADHFEPDTDREYWLMCQDEDYPTFTEERAAKFSRIMPLCETHASNLVGTKPYLKDKIWITTNGIRMDLIREIEELPERNPKRIMYASSPDRGLKYVLQTFKRAREFVSDLELHAFYGFNNIDKLIDMSPEFSHYKKLKVDIESLMDQDGVHFHGRVSQRQLYHEWLKSGIWLYQTNFSETSCITCMEAQALGAIPIFNPTWALAHNVYHGIRIEGDAWNDRLIKGRYLGELIRLASDEDLQEQIRSEMMLDSMQRFNWERVVDQWEASLYTPEHPHIHSQLIFQRKHAEGKILNLGCNGDFAGFRSIGAVNVDICEIDPALKTPNEVDIIADARDLPESLYNQFDCVIVGEMLEHMVCRDGVKVLQSAREALQNGGKIIITCPSDDRGIEEDIYTGEPIEDYAEGISGRHRYVTEPGLTGMVQAAGLSIDRIEEIDYTHFLGWGIVCS